MGKCIFCKSNVDVLIDFGKQPIRNRFLKSAEEDETLYSLVVGQCQKCALIQLINPLPADELAPLFDWITYVEAEDHLDDLADIMEKLPGLSNNSKIMALSFKDDTLIERMKKKG
ncbi:SAM-dependent methyltransferase, partial [Candidatus Woesearchaeota archaeon]|nr:SAM-dependent methyltransferase [Candidatus Woesearchaeota archaeon]